MDFSRDPVTYEQESLTSLIRDLRDESANMMRQQIELAKSETGEKIDVLGRSAASVFSAGLILYAGLLFLLTALTFGLYGLFTNAGLARTVSYWLSPLITAAVTGAVGYFMYRKAISTIKHTTVVPEKTVRSLKEDKQWITNRK